MVDNARRVPWAARQAIVLFSTYVPCFLVLLLAFGLSPQQAFWSGLFLGSAAIASSVSLAALLVPRWYMTARARMLTGAPPVRVETAESMGRYLRVQSDPTGAIVFSEARVRLFGLTALPASIAVLAAAWFVFKALGLI